MMKIFKLMKSAWCQHVEFPLWRLWRNGPDCRHCTHGWYSGSEGWIPCPDCKTTGYMFPAYAAWQDARLERRIVAAEIRRLRADYARHMRAAADALGDVGAEMEAYADADACRCQLRDMGVIV